MTKSKVPQAIAVLPLRNSVFFPRQVMPLSIGRESSIKVVEEALKEDSLVVIVAQTDATVEKPTEKDIYWVGTAAKVLKTLTLADGTKSVLMQGLRRVKLISILHTDPYIRAVVVDSDEPSETGIEIDAMVTNLKSLFKKAVELSPNLSDEQLSIILNMDQAPAVADLLASMLPVTVEEKQQVLETMDLKKRLEKRGYSKQKIRENMDAEIFDVCLNEAKEEGHKIKIVRT